MIFSSECVILIWYTALRVRTAIIIRTYSDTGGNIMPYPIITPVYFEELSDKNNPENNGVEFLQLTTPAALEIVFPINQERVIRRLMDQTGIMEYKMIKMNPEAEPEFAAKAEEIIKNTPVLKYYWNIKTITINLLQDRRYTLNQRMLMLNFVYKTIQAMLDKQREDAVNGFIASTIREPDHSGIMNYFNSSDSVKPSPAFALADGLTFLRSLPESEELKKLRTIVFKKYKIDQDMKDYIDQDMKTYKYTEEHEAIRKAYNDMFTADPEKPADEEKISRTHYMEQIIINYVWTYCMPYADFRLDLWSNYIFFNIIYNSLKVTVAGYLYESTTPDEDFVFAIKTFDDALRTVKGSMVARIKDANEKMGLCNNGDMAILTIGW